MKKTFFVFLIAVLSFACSTTNLLGPAGTPTPALSSTNTYTPIPTATPVTPTLTFTATPTMIGLKSPTPTAEISETPFVSVTPLELITPNTVTPSVQMEGFIAVRTSVTEFYKGRICDPSYVKFSAQVLDRDRVAYVLLFVRFRSLNEGKTSEWSSIPMETIGAGTYVHDLYSDEMKKDGFYTTAWIDYQFVATTSDATEIGRTALFKQKLKMLPCVPTPTSTSATITP